MKIGRVLHPRRSTSEASPPPAPPPAPKAALLIGIDYVDAPADSDYPPLRRARSDTKDFRDLLICTSSIAPRSRMPSPTPLAAKYDYLPENVIVMLDQEGIEPNLWPTRANIVSTPPNVSTIWSV